MNETLKASLLLSVPNKYSLEWSGKENAPIRYKLDHYFQNRKSIDQLNSLWIDALAKITNSNPIKLEKYIRINAPVNGDVVYISVFPNATVMIQGDQATAWARNNLENVCNEVNSYIEDHFYSIDVSGSLIPDETSTSVLGICMICDSFDDDEMLECRNEKCRSWYHNKCEGLTESEARKISPYFCRNCREKYSLDMGATTLTPSKKESIVCEKEKEMNITNNPNQPSQTASLEKEKVVYSSKPSPTIIPADYELCNRGILTQQKPLNENQAHNVDKTSNCDSQNVCNLLSQPTKNDQVQTPVKTQPLKETHIIGSQTKAFYDLNSLDQQVPERPRNSNTSTPIPTRKVEMRQYPTSPIQEETATYNNQTVIGNIQSKLKGMSSYMMEVLGLSKYDSSDEDESQTSCKENTTTPSVLIGDSKEQSSIVTESSIDNLYKENDQDNPMISDDDTATDSWFSESASAEKASNSVSTESFEEEVKQNDQVTPIDNAATEPRSPRSATKESQTETQNFVNIACQTSNDKTSSIQHKPITDKPKKCDATSQTDPVGKNINEEKLKHLEFLLEESNKKNEKLRNEVGLHEEMNNVTGNKASNKNKERYEHRSYNELIKECLKLEERNTKLLSTMNVIKEEKNRYKQIVTSLKEENQSLQVEIDLQKSQKTQNTSIIEDINILKEQMNKERSTINNINELLIESNKKMECQMKQEKELMDQIIKISKENNDLKLEKSKLLIKNLKLQSNDWQTIDEAESNLDSSFSSINSIEIEDPKSDVNKETLIGNATSANKSINRPKDNGNAAEESRHPTGQMHEQESRENIDNSVVHLGSQPPWDRRHLTAPDSNPKTRINEGNFRHHPRNVQNNQILPSETNARSGITNHENSTYPQRKSKSRGFRPICPWYIKGRCNSQFCIYHHPQPRYANTTDQKLKYNNQPKIQETDKYRSNLQNERYNKNCKYFLENRCKFAESCYYKHPTEM